MASESRSLPMAFVSFVILASKTRVSPLKTQTIPRLKLLSALLLARLISSITQALESELELSTLRCYTDLTVALFWIQGVGRGWKPFMQNRVSEIRNKVFRLGSLRFPKSR